MTASISDFGVLHGPTASSIEYRQLAATVTSNAITVTFEPSTIAFRSITLTSGTPVALQNSSQLSLVIASTDSFGAVTADGTRRIAILAINNAGTIVLGAVSLAGGLLLDEASLITTVTSATTNTSIKATSAISNVAYRVVGFVEVPFTTSTGWGTISKVQNSTGASTWAGSQVTITDDVTTSATMYPLWVTGTTGILPTKVASTKLTLNPSTGVLSTINIGVNGSQSGTAGDITCARNTTQGVVYFGSTGGRYLYNDGTNFNLNAGGLICTGDITAFSDIRVKTDIEIIPDALNKVLTLRGVTFRRTDVADTSLRHAGVIAQEVEKVLPEVVTESKEGADGAAGGIKTVAYGNMVGLLIEAIKDLKTEVDTLRAEIAQLKK